jgi:hypothetical protein
LGDVEVEIALADDQSQEEVIFVDVYFCDLVADHLLGFLEWFIIEEERAIIAMGFKSGRRSK